MARLSMISDADLSTSEGLIVGVDSNGLASLLTAATVGNNIVGVLLDGGSASGDETSVASQCEVAFVRAGAATTAGAWVTVNAASKCIATTTDEDEVLGKALTSAGAADDWMQVIVNLGTLSAT